MDKNLFKMAAKFSKLAYQDEIPLYPFEMIRYDKTDTEAFIIKYNADVLFVVFRGTERCFKDIATDLNFFRKTMPISCADDKIKIRVHSGFASAYFPIKSKIIDRIEDHNAKTVIHCGHSLGGALAQLSILDGCYDYSPIKIEHIGITFGQPAVGNLAFNRFFREHVKNYYRFVNHFDFITWLPFTSLHSTKKIQLSTYSHDIDDYIRGVDKWA